MALICWYLSLTKYCVHFAGLPGLPRGVPRAWLSSGQPGDDRSRRNLGDTDRAACIHCLWNSGEDAALSMLLTLWCSQINDVICKLFRQHTKNIYEVRIEHAIWQRTYWAVLIFRFKHVHERVTTEAMAHWHHRWLTPRRRVSRELQGTSCCGFATQAVYTSNGPQPVHPTAVFRLTRYSCEQ